MDISTSYSYINHLYTDCEIVSHKSKKPNTYLLDVVVDDEIVAVFVHSGTDLEQLV